MAFSVGDKVTLSAARGGHDVFIRQVIGGPDGRNSYRYISRDFGDPDKGSGLVDELDVAAGPLALPTFNNGDQVTLYGTAGTIVADNGDGTFEVDVEIVWNEHLTTTRRHSEVPTYVIGIENDGS